MMGTGYFAPSGFEEQLKSELKSVTKQYGQLILTDGPPQKTYWAQNIWFDPQILPFKSISDAAKQLRSRQKLWSFYPYALPSKGKLITEQLAFFSPKPLPFPSPLPAAPLGSWMLLDERTILAAPVCSSPFAQGGIHFQESKAPPSRAYLKLWETFIRIGKMPKANETCLEIGASPGSWTWVLQQTGAKTYAVDRALLDPAIASLPNISFQKGDAFQLGPSDFPKLDWIFSDVVCYPEKLLEWIHKWPLPEINFVCTIKFQGSDGYAILPEFEKIEGSQIFHLFHNKHELTWVKLKEGTFLPQSFPT